MFTSCRWRFQYLHNQWSIFPKSLDVGQCVYAASHSHLNDCSQSVTNTDWNTHNSLVYDVPPIWSFKYWVIYWFHTTYPCEEKLSSLTFHSCSLQTYIEMYVLHFQEEAISALFFFGGGSSLDQKASPIDKFCIWKLKQTWPQRSVSFSVEAPNSIAAEEGY